MKMAVMDLTYVQGHTLHQFIANNMDFILKEWNYTGGKFKFFQSAKATPNSLQQTFENLFLIIGREKPKINRNELAKWAEQIGRKRAKNDFPIYYTLELFHEFRDLFWKTLYSYIELSEIELDSNELIELERYYNQAIDFAIYHFAVNYVRQKNEITRLQQLALKTPRVPLTPLTDEIALSTLIGSMDASRLENWTEETIDNIEKLKIHCLIVDVNHLLFTDPTILKSFLHSLQGFQWIGCHTILTGMNYKDGRELIKTGALPEGLVIHANIKQAIASLGGLSVHPEKPISSTKELRRVQRKRQ
ncbi:hypothetical protein BEP19_08410 [Ammoniphilus oxalaticus]|uniref:STAS domain-containing protein n=1 Tax=Ammoniphilus oxalaticus TaxID=66863 RepID=A0A419SK60_9BACL|nr:STAS domain-containing protein [Ammoniphilus oxalaticus]RKD24403.1 hypothetical protein BEP19_08410 [Ammoniphilus oxalaticus]